MLPSIYSSPAAWQAHVVAECFYCCIALRMLPFSAPHGGRVHVCLTAHPPCPSFCEWFGAGPLGCVVCVALLNPAAVTRLRAAPCCSTCVLCVFGKRSCHCRGSLTLQARSSCLCSCVRFFALVGGYLCRLGANPCLLLANQLSEFGASAAAACCTLYHVGRSHHQVTLADRKSVV